MLPEITALQSDSPFLYFTIVYLFLFTQAMIFNRIVVNQRLLQKANYYPAMCYLLLTSLFPEWNMLSSVLIITTLLIWSFAKMNKLFNTAEPKTIVFDISLIISLASFIFQPSIFYAILIAIALIINRPFRIREWVVLFLGIITPYYFLMFQLFFRENDLKKFKFKLLKPLLPYFHINALNWSLIGLLLLMFIIGLYFVFKYMRKQVVQVRKCWALLLFYLLLSTLIIIFYSGGVLTYGLLALIPLSAYFASYFFYSRYRLFLIISHWLLVALIIYTGFFIK